MIPRGRSTSAPWHRGRPAHPRPAPPWRWPDDESATQPPEVPPQPSATTFPSEAALVVEFVRLLKSGETPFGRVRVILEFEYIRGRTDVVAIDAAGKVIAFEMKLRRWSEALQQGYRNRCFAHASYVVMPTSVARLAQRKQHQFERRGVGFCTARVGKVDLAINAARAHPLQPALTARAVALAQE